MNTATPMKMVIAILLLGLVVIIALLFNSIKGMKEENEELLLAESRLNERIKTLTHERDYKREYFNRLIYDEEFAARVIRQKLGFSEPDEIIFRFEKNRPMRVDDALVSEQPASQVDDADKRSDALQAKSKPSSREKSIIEHLLFWNKDEKASPENVAQKQSKDSQKIKLDEIRIESELEEKKITEEKIAEARGNVDTIYELVRVEKPVRERVRFITPRSGSAKPVVRRAATAIEFVSN